MSLILVAVGMITAYAAIGIGVCMLRVRLFPSRYFVLEEEPKGCTYACGFCGKDHGKWPAGKRTEVDDLALFSGLWPLGVFVLAFDVALRATKNSLVNQTKARSELESELKAAKKEIDDLLGRKP